MNLTNSITSYSNTNAPYFIKKVSKIIHNTEVNIKNEEAKIANRQKLINKYMEEIEKSNAIIEKNKNTRIKAYTTLEEYSKYNKGSFLNKNS